MPTYRTQVALQDISGLSKDQYVNTWYFTRPTPATPIELGQLTADLSTVYQALAPSLSAGVSRVVHPTCKHYLVGAPLESPPVLDDVLPLLLAPTAGALSLPGEVAVCLSFHADFQPGVIRQSWRGRVYLGPLNSSVLGAAPGTARPTGAIGIDGAMAQFTNELVPDGFTWVIYSKKLGKVFPVSRWNIDNAFDTQRRRGVAPTGNLVEGTVAAGQGTPSGPA